MRVEGSLTRQMSIIPMESLDDAVVTVIGAGAVGSWTVKALTRMGVSDITVIDYDTVDFVNLNSQGYKPDDIGQYKVDALSESVKQETGIDIRGVREKYTGGSFRGIVIAAVDNMETRKLIWDEHKNSFGTLAVIDPRMGAEQASLFVALPSRPGSYEKSLFTDEEGVHEPCTAKATIYTAYLLSGLVVKAVKDLITNRENYLSLCMWSIDSNEVMLHEKRRTGGHSVDAAIAPTSSDTTYAIAASV